MNTPTTRKLPPRTMSRACKPHCSCLSCRWEPFKSFETCGEEIIQRFWDRVDTKGRDVDSIEGWTNGEEVYPMGPPRMPSVFIFRRGILLSVEAERTRRRPEKVNGPIPDHQGMNIPPPVGRRMGWRKRDH